MIFDKTIVIVTPWFGGFAGGAASLAKGMATEFNRRGVGTKVFATCSRSPYDSWWEDHFAPGVYDVEGVETHRFATANGRSQYQAVVRKMQRDFDLTAADQQDFFECGINSSQLVSALKDMTGNDHEVLALPYFHGLTHSLVNKYPGRISLIPCFHDESQFYWHPTEQLLRNAKRIVYNSPEEKAMTIKQYGQTLGRVIVEGVVAGVGVELPEFTDEPGSQISLPEKYFVYAGRKEAGKNVPLLCEWFAEYARYGETKLVFIGGGEAGLLPRNDCFLDLGVVSEPIKQQVIRGARGLISLSKNESFSIVIMEAWLLGVPVVVSAEGAVLKGHARRSNGGLYVENEAEFAAALDYLEQNETVRHQLAAQGREYVSENFSFDVVLGRYLQAFNGNGSGTENALAR